MALTRLTHLDLSSFDDHIRAGDLLGISALKELRSLHLAHCQKALTAS